jgi:hypothetical protein
MMEDENNIVVEQPHESTTEQPEQMNDMGNQQESIKSEQTDDTEDAPQSSIDNIVPLQNLKRGWMAISGLLAGTAQKVQDSAIEAYNSESVQQFKKKTTEVITPAWEKTVEVAAPVWERTKVTANVALEKTKEGITVVGEKMKPAMESVRTNRKSFLTQIYCILFIDRCQLRCQKYPNR